MLYPNPGGPRQPLDRQLRYYSEALRLASATLVGSAPGNASEHAFPTSATRNKSVTGAGHTAPSTTNGKVLEIRQINTVFVLPHPSHKNKDVARMGHPKVVGIYLPKQ